MTIPTPNDIIVFVIFFFPGFITSLFLYKFFSVENKQFSDLEKIVLSSIFSIFSFLVLGVPIQVETISAAVLDPITLTWTFLTAIVLACSIWIIIKSFSFFGDFISPKIHRVLANRGKDHTSKNSCFPHILRQLYDARDKNEVIVHTMSGEMYKGSLEAYAENPLEIILMATKKNYLQQLNEEMWEDINEYMICFIEKDIKRISVRTLI